MYNNFAIENVLILRYYLNNVDNHFSIKTTRKVSLLFKQQLNYFHCFRTFREKDFISKQFHFLKKRITVQ